MQSLVTDTNQASIKRIKKGSKRRNSGKTPSATKETEESKDEKVTEGFAKQAMFNIFKSVSNTQFEERFNQTNSNENENSENSVPSSTEVAESKALEFDASKQKDDEANDIEMDRERRYKLLLKSSAAMIGEISQMFGRLLDASQYGRVHVLLNMQNIKSLKNHVKAIEN